MNIDTAVESAVEGITVIMKQLRGEGRLRFVQCLLVFLAGTIVLWDDVE